MADSWRGPNVTESRYARSADSRITVRRAETRSCAIRPSRRSRRTVSGLVPSTRAAWAIVNGRSNGPCRCRSPSNRPGCLDVPGRLRCLVEPLGVVVAARDPSSVLTGTGAASAAGTSRAPERPGRRRARSRPSTSTVPVDGALRGPDSQAEVTAVAWPYEADGYVANTGDRLVAFTVQLTEPTSDATGFTSTGPTLVARRRRLAPAARHHGHLRRRRQLDGEHRHGHGHRVLRRVRARTTRRRSTSR